MRLKTIAVLLTSFVVSTVVFAGENKMSPECEKQLNACKDDACKAEVHKKCMDHSKHTS